MVLRRVERLLGVLLVFLLKSAVEARAGVNEAERLSLGRQIQVDRYGDPLPPGAIERRGSMHLRHTMVSAIAFAPDGRTLVSVGSDDTIRFWDISTAKEVHRIRLRGLFSSSIAFSPDGKTLAVGCKYGGEIILVDCISGKESDRFTGIQPIRVAFCLDGRWLAAAEEWHKIVVWDARSGRRLAEVNEFNVDHVEWLDFSPDGETLAYASRVRSGLCDWRTETLAKELPAAIAGRFSADGKSLRLIEPSGKLVVMALTAPKANASYPTPRDVRTGALSPDGSRIVCETYSGERFIQDLAKGKKFPLERPASELECHSLIFSPGGGAIAGCAWEGILLWNAATGKLLHRTDSLKYTESQSLPDRRFLLNNTTRGVIRLWDTFDNSIRRSFGGEDRNVVSFDVSHDGKILITGEYDGAVVVWNVESGKIRRTFKLSQRIPKAYRPATVVLSPSGNIVAAAQYRSVSLLDLRSGQKSHSLEKHSNRVNGMAFSADGSTLTTASEDGTLRTCDVASGKELNVCRPHEGWPVRVVVLSGDSKIMATAADDGSVAVFNTAKYGVIRCFQGHTDIRYPFSLALSPDGSRVACTVDEHSFGVSEVVTGNLLRRGTNPDSTLYGVKFGSDGKTIVSDHADGTQLVWDVALLPPVARNAGDFLKKGTGTRQVAENSQVLDARAGASPLLENVPDAAVKNGPSLTLKAEKLPPGAMTRVGTTQWQFLEVGTVVFSPDGKKIAVVPEQFGQTAVLDVTAGTRISFPIDGTPYGNEVTFSPDGRYLVSARNDDIYFGDTATGRAHVRYVQYPPQPSAFALAPNGKSIALAGGCEYGPDGKQDLGVRFFDIATDQQFRRLEGLTSPIVNMYISRDGSRLAAYGQGDFEKKIKASFGVWDLPSGRLLHRVEMDPELGPCQKVTFSDDCRLAVHARDKQVTLWDLERGAQRMMIQAWSCALSRDGTTLATSGGTSGVVEFWDTATGKRRKQWTFPVMQSPYVAAFSPDGTILAITHRAFGVAALRLYDVASGKDLHSPVSHVTGITCLSFSPDGEALLTGSSDRTVRSWNVATGKPGRVFGGHDEGIAAVTVSYDGKLIASLDARDNVTVYQQFPDGGFLAETSLFLISPFANRFRIMPA